MEMSLDEDKDNETKMIIASEASEIVDLQVKRD
jgi:hypothetical protein